jgi:hypothetical protein
MLTWLYDIFVAIVSFVMSFFGFDLKKRSVTFASDVKEEEEKKEEGKSDNDKSDEVVAPQGVEGSVALTE